MSGAAPPLDLLVDGPQTSRLTVILAHGAGAPMDSPFMEFFAHELAGRGRRVVRFEFPYMARRRLDGGRKPPDREPLLRQTWRRAVDRAASPRLILGGKSLGGRIASLIADEVSAAGLVCLGYPFHPTGKPDRIRTEHLRSLRTPTLMLQGTRDALGSQLDVASYSLSDQIRLHWLPDGDHSFKPRKASGRTEQDNWQEAVEVMDEFLRRLH